MTRVTEPLVALLAALQPSNIPDSATRIAKLVLLDATGVMLGASGLSEEAASCTAMAATAGSGPCRVLGTPVKTAPAMAAFANGAMAHALDYEDAFDLAPGHPNASLVPALLALAQWRAAQGDPVDGPRFIAALVAGCELSCRMALALRRRMEEGHWYPPPILAGFGAALGSAHLLGLSPQRMIDALSLALCQVTMPGEIKHSRRTVIRAIREAFPAQAAVQSALLAQEGLAGFEQPLEGPGGFYALYAAGRFAPEALLAPIDHGLWIERLTFKPWPSCRGTHPFIEMALDLQQAHGFAIDGIVAIEADVGPMQRMLVEPESRKQAPDTAIDAKFSIPFCIASALVDRAITLDSFAEDRLRDPGTLSLAAKVRWMQPSEAESWRGDAGALRLHLADGRILSAGRDAARGAPTNPLGEDELVDKFVDCAGRAALPLTPEDARILAGKILSLENCGDVGALFVG